MRVFSPVIVALGLFACSQSPPPKSVEPPKVEKKATVQPLSYQLRELTQEESQYLPGLKAHMAFLSTKLGRREPLDAWAMADSADYIAGQFSEAGYPPERIGFELQGSPLQNLAVTVPGGARGNEVVLVVVHYDSPAIAGQEAVGAAATAILLELARDLRQAKLSRTLKLVALAVGESPYLEQSERGSVYYLRQLLKDQGQKLLFSLHMDHVAAFSTPHVPNDLSSQPALLLETSPGAPNYADPLMLALRVSPFMVKERQFISAHHGGTDGETFHQAGLPVIRLSGAMGSKQANLKEMALFTSAIRAALGQIALEGG